MCFGSPSVFVFFCEDSCTLFCYSANGQFLGERKLDSRLKSKIFFAEDKYFCNLVFFVDGHDRLWILKLPQLKIINVEGLKNKYPIIEVNYSKEKSFILLSFSNGDVKMIYPQLIREKAQLVEDGMRGGTSSTIARRRGTFIDANDKSVMSRSKRLN